MSTPPGRDELVAQFIGVTNAPASEAEHLLEAAGWDLDTAAQLHFEGAGNAAATASTAPAPRAEDEMQDLDEFMNNARMPRPGPTAPQIGEDGVRVADSVKRERLFDTRHTRQPRVHIGHGGPDVQPMPFGDLDPDASKRTGPGLDSIYQPPNEILSSLQLAEYASTSIFVEMTMMLWTRCVYIVFSVQDQRRGRKRRQMDSIQLAGTLPEICCAKYCVYTHPCNCGMDLLTILCNAGQHNLRQPAAERRLVAQ